jgi:hypothetical protein
MTRHFVIARAQPEAIQEVNGLHGITNPEAGNFLDRHGPSGLAMTVKRLTGSR